MCNRLEIAFGSGKNFNRWNYYGNYVLLLCRNPFGIFCMDSSLSYHQSSTEVGISFHWNAIHRPLKYTVLKAKRLQSKSVLSFRRHKQNGRNGQRCMWSVMVLRFREIVIFIIESSKNKCVTMLFFLVC